MPEDDDGGLRGEEVSSSPRRRAALPCLLATAATLLLLSACKSPEERAAELAATDPFNQFGQPGVSAPLTGGATPLTPGLAGGAALPSGAATSLRPAAPRIASGIYPGTGQLVGPGRSEIGPARRAGASVTPGGEVELSFVGAEVRDVARIVLSDILGLGFAVGPSVTGTMTLETSGPIERSAVLPVFESALRLAGFAISVQGGLYTVTEATNAARSGIVARGQPGFGTEVIAPRYVGAAAIRRLIEPVVRDGQLTQIDPARNILLVTGTEAERRAVRDMVAQFDVDWMRGMSFSIYAARRAPARRLAEDLNQLIGGEGGAIAGLVRIVPLERLNAVLAISAQPRYLQQIQAWAERLDREGAGEDRQVFVYRVQNGRAADLARVLGRAFGVNVAADGPGQGGPGRGGAPGGGAFQGGSPFGTTAPTVPGAGGRSGGGGFGASPISNPLSALTEPLVTPAQAPDAAPFSALPPGILGGGAPGQPGGAQPGPAQAGISITSDETNNAIVIVASPRQYDSLQAALLRLDVQPLQVLIEAAVAEVTLSNALRFGLQWALTTGQNTFTLNQNQVNPSVGTASGSTGAAINALRGALLPQVLNASVPVPTYPNFSYVYSAPNITVVLEALDQLTDVKVLSAPQLLVLNNQTATLQVGDQVPIQTQSAQSTLTAGAPLVSSIEYRDTGVILRVTPRVNESGLVLLDVAQEVSAVVQATQNNTLAAQLSPTIQQRRLASSIAVQDGQTVALGGLIRDARQRSGGGVPVLSSIPVLGYLFGRTNDAVDRTELLVMLTPRVIRSPRDANAVTEELRNRLREVRPIVTPVPVAPNARRLVPGFAPF